MRGAGMDAPLAVDLAAFYSEMRSTGLVRRLLEIARDEDLGPSRCDLTSERFVGPRERLRCAVVARQSGVVAGLAVIPDMLEVFEFASSIEWGPDTSDGAVVAPGDVIATLDGDARAVLTFERTMLNLLGRMSGVATITRRYRGAMGGGTRVQLFDTRKTTPGLRVFEKYAVLCGGGRSHRLGLFDAVLVKDNHLAGVGLDQLAGRLTAAARNQTGDPNFFEVEVDGLDQLQRVLEVDEHLVDIVLLDNFGLADLRAAVAMRDRSRPNLRLEASGGVTLETIRAIAETGVDRISVGALTHSATSLDFGLDDR